MNLEIIYNSENVTNDIDIRTANLTDRYGGLLDSIKVGINDKDEIWAKRLAKGDKITITTDGYTTGKMYISDINSEGTLLTVDGISLKPTKKVKKSRIWRNVRLLEVLKDCAKNNGLTLKTYGISDFTYEAVAQIHKTDLEFVSLLCKREGYSVKVDNDCLVVFNEYYMENQTALMTIKPEDVDSNYSFMQSSKCVNSVTVSHYDLSKGLIEQTAVDNEVFGSAEIINERVSSYDEANRFAHGYLRNYNKQCVIGRLAMPYNPKVSAGTVLNIEGFGQPDGKYVVIEVTHIIKREISNLTIRKTLSY